MGGFDSACDDVSVDLNFMPFNAGQYIPSFHILMGNTYIRMVGLIWNNQKLECLPSRFLQYPIAFCQILCYSVAQGDADGFLFFFLL